jgi:hypothetical protein
VGAAEQGAGELLDVAEHLGHGVGQDRVADGVKLVGAPAQGAAQGWATQKAPDVLGKITRALWVPVASRVGHRQGMSAPGSRRYDSGPLSHPGGRPGLRAFALRVVLVRAVRMAALG